MGSPGYVPVNVGSSAGALFGEMKSVCWAMEVELGDYGRDLMIEMQPILDRRLRGKNPIVWALDEVRTQLLTLLGAYAREARELLILPTQQWSKPLTFRDTHTGNKHLYRTSPEYSISVYIDATDSSVVGTKPSSTRKYVWTNWGTKERHQRPVHAKTLKFSKVYSPATSPGSLSGGKASTQEADLTAFNVSRSNGSTLATQRALFGQAYNKTMHSMKETQNSVTPRRFDIVVAELLQPALESDVTKAVARAFRKMGNLGKYGTTNTNWGKEFKFTPGYQKWNIQPYLFKKRFSQSSNKWR